VGPANPDSRVLWDFPYYSLGVWYPNYFEYLKQTYGQGFTHEHLRGECVLGYMCALSEHMLRCDEGELATIRDKVKSLKVTFCLQGVMSGQSLIESLNKL